MKIENKIYLIVNNRLHTAKQMSRTLQDRDWLSLLKNSSSNTCAAKQDLLENLLIDSYFV